MFLGGTKSKGEQIKQDGHLSYFQMTLIQLQEILS